MAQLVPLFALCMYICGMRGESSSTFTIYPDQAPSSLPAGPVEVISITPAMPLRCHAACVRRASCASFWISGTSCKLYDTCVDDPASQLQAQQGDVFFSIAVSQRVSVTTVLPTTVNGGYVNIFPQLSFNKAGRVLRWEVMCKTAGQVMLAVWRGSPASMTLVGKNRVTVPAGMEDKLMTYEVPATERIQVKAGDFVGFHYDRTVPEARVRVLLRGNAPADIVIEDGYGIDKADTDLPVGATVGSPALVAVLWTPVLAVYAT